MFSISFHLKKKLPLSSLTQILGIHFRYETQSICACPESAKILLISSLKVLRVSHNLLRSPIQHLMILNFLKQVIAEELQNVSRGHDIFPRRYSCEEIYSFPVFTAPIIFFHFILGCQPQMRFEKRSSFALFSTFASFTYNTCHCRNLKDSYVYENVSIHVRSI